MAYPERRFHEEFSTERIVKEIRLVSPDLLVGDCPTAFARKLILRWGFWSQRYGFDPSRWVVMLLKDEVPEELQGGFSLHVGAIMTSRSTTPTMLNRMDHAKNFYADRLLDAQSCRGEFASNGRKAS